MNLDSLTHTSGEWLRGTGPEADIVISSRIRLARNLSTFPFTNRASAHQKAEVEHMLREKLGNLTACPTNVGTGMRASVMLHLPALVLTKQIEKVFRALQKINLAVRGLYGEGSRASGDFYQISNQVTLGKREEDITREIREVIPQVFNYERLARQSLIKDNRSVLQDKVA